MSDTSANNKRIAKNTLMLYIGMLFTMFITLLTSRVVLQTLGVEDYGIYSVVGGVITMFAFINGGMVSSTQRYLNFEIATGNAEKLRSVFNTSLQIHALIALGIIILGETVGLWFLLEKLVIPNDRMTAAMWVYQCSIIACAVNILSAPYNADIIAHEKMSAFAYMTIIDAVLKLAICYALYASPIDKLITYAILGVVVSIITTSIYWIYCLRKFEETSFTFRFDKALFKEIWGFAGWNLFAQTAWILNTQGINMLMNLFFGVIVNAARGVAVQVNGIIQSFVNNFMMALNPQITKSYAAGDKDTAFRLACRGCRFSFYIMWLFSLPIMIESHQILELWLGTPPEQADVFVVWTILSTLATLLGNTLVTLQMAHGNIKHYQIWITIFGCFPFPLTWLAFELGAPSIISYYIYVIVYWGLIYVRYHLVHGMTGIPARMYLGGVVAKSHIVAFLSSIIPVTVFILIPESLVRLLIVGSTSIISSCIFIYYLGIDDAERYFIKDKVLSRIPSRLH